MLGLLASRESFRPTGWCTAGHCKLDSRLGEFGTEERLGPSVRPGCLADISSPLRKSCVQKSFLISRTSTLMI